MSRRIDVAFFDLENAFQEDVAEKWGWEQQVVPMTRERAMVKTKLEEARMWHEAALSRPPEKK